MKREIIYGSDPQPSDHILRNLAIFYDKIYLPHPYGLSEDTRALWSNWEMSFQDDLDYGYSHYRKWEERNAYLFEEGIVEILPDIFDSNLVADNVGEELIRRFGITHLDNYNFNKQELLSRSIRINKRFILDGALALALHYAYSKVDAPHFIWSQDIRYGDKWNTLSEQSITSEGEDFSTVNIQNRLIGQLLSCESTMLNVSEPGEVLKLRSDYADEREAVGFFLSELSDSVRRHLRDGAIPDEAAKRTLEAEVLPKIAEFNRLKRLNEQKRFMKYISGFMNIDAGPWSPKFFYQLSKAILGSTTGLSENRMEDSTNRVQSFRLFARMSAKKA